MKSNLPSPELETWRWQTKATIVLAAAHHPSADFITALRESRDLLEDELRKHIAAKGGKP